MKRWLKSLLLVLCLALAVGGVYGVRELTKPRSAEETSGEYPLTEQAETALTALSWETEEGAYRFVREDGVWRRDGDDGFPVSQQTLNDMAQELTALTASRRIAPVENLGDYGVDTPVFTIAAEWSDGTSAVYAMGDALPFGDGYYLSLSSQSDTVYAISQSLETLFKKDALALAEPESLPEVGNADRLTVGGALDAAYREESTDLNPGQHWYAQDGMPLDGEAMEELIEKVKSVAWEELVETVATAERLAEMGLDDGAALPVTLYEGGEAALTLLVGSLENGSYYVRLPDSGMVYTVSSTALADIVGATQEKLAVTALLPLEAAQLAEATLTAGDHTVTIAGAPAEDSAESELWTLAAALSGGEAAEADAAERELLLTVFARNENGVEKTVSFYAYDRDSYLAQPDSGAARLVPAADVDELIRALRAME